MKTIAVITVTFNAARHFERLVTSLRDQSDRDFEFVVIDGASGDSTWSMIEASRDVVTYAISEPDRGVYDAINKAVRALRGRAEYYVVVGSDDTLFPDAIANYRAVVAKTGADVVVAGVRAGGRVRSGFHPRRAWLGHGAMITSHSVGMLFKARLHDEFGDYSLRYSLIADGHFIKRVCSAKDVKTVVANFVAGEFGLGGASNSNLIRALCESWEVQIETGENRLIQYLLFQFRLLKCLSRILRNGPERQCKASQQRDRR